MGKAIPIELPSITFPKQSDAIEYFKQMLGRYSNGQRINEEDSLLLAQLLLRHPDDKIGVGVEYFYKERNPEQPTSGFHVMRTDGDWTDFSYIRCIKGKRPTVDDYFYRACRFAVSPYLTLKKNRFFEQGRVVYSKTGELVTKETSDYRHTSPSFKSLVEAFRGQHSIEVDWTLFPPDRDRQYDVRFVDPDLELRFVAYHQSHANLALFKKHLEA
jgi:hypothetical protein